MFISHKKISLTLSLSLSPSSLPTPVTGFPSATSDGADLMTAGNILKNITELASPDGDSLQSVATYINDSMFKNLNGVPRLSD